jgi:hypothetical protein
VPVGVRVGAALHLGDTVAHELVGTVAHATLRDDGTWRVEVCLDRPLTPGQLAALLGPRQHDPVATDRQS